MILAFSTSCTSDKELKQAIAEAEAAKAQVEAVKRAAMIAAKQAELPSYPEECREKERSGIVGSDKADAALIKADAALERYSDKQDQCAGWYENVKAVHNLKPASGDAR